MGIARKQHAWFVCLVKQCFFYFFVLLQVSVLNSFDFLPWSIQFVSLRPRFKVFIVLFVLAVLHIIFFIVVTKLLIFLIGLCFPCQRTLWMKFQCIFVISFPSAIIITTFFFHSLFNFSLMQMTKWKFRMLLHVNYCDFVIRQYANNAK